jgi:hypothetical protein
MTKLVKAGAAALTRDELIAVSGVQIRTGFIIQEARRGDRAQRSVRGLAAQVTPAANGGLDRCAQPSEIFRDV